MLREEAQMKKVLSLLMVICLSIGITVGCGNTKDTNTQEEKFADEDFMKDLSKSLETRWAMNDADTGENYAEGSDKQKELFLKWTKAELDIVGKYEDEKFEDSKLKELAIQYINCLKDQEEAAKYVTVDYTKFSELWETAYNSRTQLIEQFKTDYDLKVSEKYQSTLDDLLTNAQLVTEEQTEKSAVEEFIKNIQFSVESDDYGLKTCSAVVENTTGYGFKSLSLTINLLDAEGVIVETTFSSVQNFASGSKAKFEFMTNKEFSSTDVKAEFYEIDK